MSSRSARKSWSQRDHRHRERIAGVAGVRRGLSVIEDNIEPQQSSALA